MAIVEKLLVTTPLTNDGVNPVYIDGPDGAPVIKTRKSIVEKSALAELEKLNQTRSRVLRETYEVIKVDEATGKEVKLNAAEPKVDNRDETIKKQEAEIEALKKQLASKDKEAKNSKEKEPTEKSKQDVLHSAETKTETKTVDEAKK